MYDTHEEISYANWTMPAIWKNNNISWYLKVVPNSKMTAMILIFTKQWACRTTDPDYQGRAGRPFGMREL